MPSDHNHEDEESTPLPAESPTTPPKRIGRYKVCRKLGGGTFGDVYLAHDDLMDRQVAIKVPSAWLLASQAPSTVFYLDMFEARIVAKLQHEGIVRAYDFGIEEDGSCYIVYEFIEGTNLAERIKPDRIAVDPLLLEQAATIIAQVAEALHYAHLQGLVHRDIKPANILLNRQGKPCLTDFGLAVREVDLPNQRGRLAGTLPYMSPEQVRREAHHIDGRTDIYSLGVVLYELLCGRHPFVAKTEDELVDQILHREAKPPRQIKDSIPAELERICLKALSKRTTERYTTAQDLSDDLRHFQQTDLPENATNASVNKRVMRPRHIPAPGDFDKAGYVLFHTWSEKDRAQLRIAVDPHQYLSFGELLDDLFQNYLSSQFDPYTYGSQWVVQGETSDMRLLVPLQWVSQQGHAIHEIAPQWMSSSLSELDLTPNTHWTISAISDASEGVYAFGCDNRKLWNLITSNAKAIYLLRPYLKQEPLDHLTVSPRKYVGVFRDWLRIGCGCAWVETDKQLPDEVWKVFSY